MVKQNNKEEKVEIKDKLAKETENKELKEKDKIELTPIVKYDVPKEITEEVTKVFYSWIRF